MNATLVIDEQTFINSVQAEFDKVKVPCQAAMAQAFRGVVNANLGDAGVQDKPDWSPVTSKYAKRVGRTDATLRLTATEAAKVGGIPELLYDSTGVEVTNPDASFVWNGCEYAEKQQDARRFFPIVNGEVTQATQDVCVDACRKELEARLR